MHICSKSTLVQHLRLDQKDFGIMGITHKQHVFGLKTESALCKKVTDILRDVMTSCGFSHNYKVVHTQCDTNQAVDTLKALWGHGGRVVILSPPTSEAGV